MIDTKANAARVERGQWLMETVRTAYRLPYDSTGEYLEDIITDLLHCAEESVGDAELVAERALAHYRDEVTP